MVWPQNSALPGSAARLRRNRPRKGVTRPVQPWQRASPRNPGPGLMRPAQPRALLPVELLVQLLQQVRVSIGHRAGFFMSSPEQRPHQQTVSA